MSDQRLSTRYHLGDCANVEYDSANGEAYLTVTHPIAIGDKISLNPEQVKGVSTWLQEHESLNSPSI